MVLHTSWRYVVRIGDVPSDYLVVDSVFDLVVRSEGDEPEHVSAPPEDPFDRSKGVGGYNPVHAVERADSWKSAMGPHRVAISNVRIDLISRTDHLEYQVGSFPAVEG